MMASDRPTCTMLTRYSGEGGIEAMTPDVECGAPASHLHTSDPEHYACALCYAAMAEDESLASEYLKLPLPEVSTAQRLHLELEEPGAATMALLRAGLERSGMSFQHCAECSREYGCRSGSDLCPPCREPERYDAAEWAARYPERMRLTQRARLLALLLHRGSERLTIEHLADRAAEEGETDGVMLAEAALDDDEVAWRTMMWLESVRHVPAVASQVSGVKTEVHVEVRRVEPGS